MRSKLGQAQERGPAQPTSATMGQNGRSPTVKEIPYDYVATFTLEGRRGNRVQDVINISVDGAFVAVAIGYSFIPARLDLSQPPATPPPALVNTLMAIAQPAIDQRVVVQCLLTRLCGIDFKYSIIDSASGRELQNQPIHNVAGLGEPTGERPFRPLAKPVLFQPRSTIRVEVEEISEGPLYGYAEIGPNNQPTGRRIGAELYLVLHGYKILGYGTGQG